MDRSCNLDGLIMGSRCGSLDPGVTLYLMQHEGLDDDAIRTAVCTKLAAATGLELDWQANNANKPIIHTPTSPIAILALPTNEEWIIARHSAALLAAATTQ